MRFPAAYYLLLIYCTVLMRCALPVACDALSHLFNEEEHLATVHAVYGSHHLAAEVAGTVADNHSCKHAVLLQQDEPNVVHTFTQGYNNIPDCKATKFSFLPIPSSFLFNAFINGIIKPPENRLFL